MMGKNPCQLKLLAPLYAAFGFPAGGQVHSLAARLESCATFTKGATCRETGTGLPLQAAIPILVALGAWRLKAGVRLSYFY